MNKNLRFLTLFSLGGYFLIQMMIESVGVPFSELRKAWVSIVFRQEYAFDFGLARASLINTVFIITVLALFLFSIKRLRDQKRPVLLGMLLQVVMVSVLFFVVDLILLFILSSLARIGFYILFKILTPVLYSIVGILYLIGLTTIVDSGRFSWSRIKQVLLADKYRPAVILAAIPYLLAYIIPHLAVELTNMVMPPLWHNYGLPALISIAFTIMIRPVLAHNSTA